MSLAPAMGRAWRTGIAAIGMVAMIATLMILAAAPDRVGAQQTVTCYAIADSNEPGNLNSEGQVDTLVRISDALTNPTVTVIGGNGGLGTADAEAFAIRPLPDGTFTVVGWETASNLFTIDPDNAATSGGPFSIPGKVEGLTWSGTDDADAGNDLLWASYGTPANQIAAYTTTGLLAFGPYTTELGGLNSIVGVAWDPTTGNLFGIITDDTDDTDVIQIDTANGNATFVGDTDIDMEGLGFAPTGQLVGTTGNDGANAFHLINKANGAASLQSDLGTITGAFDFESVDCVSDGPPPPPPPQLETICYAISDSISAGVSDAGSPDTLVRIDTSVPSATVIGQIDGGNTISVEAFAIRPTANGPDLYGFDPDTSGGRLFLINENDGSITNIATGLGALGDVDGMTFSNVDDGDVSNDILWMSIRNVGAPADQLVSVDPSSGAILTGPVNMDASGVAGVSVNDIDAIAWDPVTGQLFGTAGSGEANSLVSINPASGAVSSVGAFGVNDIEGLGFSNTGADNGFLFGTTGKEDGATASALYLIDKASPAGSPLIIDLFSATNVTDFESVDCLNELAGPPPDPGAITAGIIGECTNPNQDGFGKITALINYASGQEPVDYSVAITGQPAQSGTINAGDPEAMVMTGADLVDGSYSVQVTNTTAGIIVANEVVPLSCFNPPPPVLTATISSECADNAGKITVNVDYAAGGVGDGVFVIDVTGQASQNVTLAGPGSDMVMYSGLAAGDYTVSVAGNGASVANAIQTISGCVANPAIDLMLLVNGEDADNPTGPIVLLNSDVMLEYKVTNTGDAALTGLTVTDDVQGAITTCPQDTLAVDEMIICKITVSAGTGQYSSTGTAMAADAAGTQVTDTDPGNYFGGDAIVTIEKATNGQDADAGTGPIVPTGDAVQWTYVVSNDGNVELTNVQVNDDREGQISCPNTSLAPGGSMTCQASGVAGEGQYTNTATVTGTPPSGPDAMDTDDSNYFGSKAIIEIVKSVNGANANAEPFPTFDEGQAITFSYVVTNAGNVALSSVAVVDSMAGALTTCPKTSLEPGETMTCELAGIAEAGLQSMTATAQGTPPSGPAVSATDPVSYIGIDPGIDVDKVTNGADGLQIPVGDSITWTYTVKNTSNVTLNNISVTDDPEGVVTCPKTSLLADETMVCTLTGAATPGAYSNTVTAVGTPEGGTAISDTDDSSYTGVTGSLGDRVWVDLNSDGLQSAGEPGVAGVRVVLWTDDDGDGAPDTEVTSTTTSAAGLYTFAGLSSNAKYIVQFDVPAGSLTSDQGGDESNDSDADPATGITAPVMVPANGSNFTVDAGLLPASLGDKVFIDGNSNGTQDAGEAPVAGLVVNLWEDTNGDGSPDVELTQTVTNDQGMYAFNGLNPTKTFVVQFVSDRPFTTQNVGDDATDSDPGADGITGAYDLDFGENNSTVDAGIIDVPGATVGDTVFNDLNENCVADVGEGLVGVTVNLIVNGQTVSTMVTGADGGYSFTGLAPGDYTVMVDAQTLGLGFLDTCGHDNANTVTLQSGDVNNNVDFGYAECATIGDRVFNDLNSNGIQDAGESGLGGVIIAIWTANADGTPDQQIDETTSASDGSYSFCVDPTEEYIIQVLGSTASRVSPLDAGDDDSTDSDIDPMSGVSAPVTVSPGESNPTVDIGIMPPVTPSDPGVSIVTLTNGSDGPEVAPGSDLTITYLVTNTGDTELTSVAVADDVYGAITCPVDVLAVAASITCTSMQTASNDAGASSNTGTVTAVGDGTDVNAFDPTNHTVVIPTAPSVTINTLTNGADGPEVAPGSDLTITYLVTNNGNADLTNVAVADDVYGPITCPVDVLAVGASTTCTSIETASNDAGASSNTGTVTAVGDGTDVTDTDPTSHTVVVDPPSNPAITIDTNTNGSDGPDLDVGSTATITYLVTNTGDVDLTGITVTDDELGAITCPQTELAAGANMTCEITKTVVEGVFNNVGSVTAVAPDGTTTVDATDPTSHEGNIVIDTTAMPAIDIETLTNGVDADVTGSGPQLGVNSAVAYSYIVTNTGNVVLNDITVVDDRLGQICTIATLAPNQNQACAESGTVVAGLFTHTGFASGTPVNGGAAVTASDPTNHTGLLATVTATATPTPAPTVTPSATVTAKKTTQPVKKATPLAVTGSDSRELALIAVGAIAAGAALVGLGRRRRDAEL